MPISLSVGAGHLRHPVSGSPHSDPKRDALPSSCSAFHPTHVLSHCPHPSARVAVHFVAGSEVELVPIAALSRLPCTASRANWVRMVTSDSCTTLISATLLTDLPAKRLAGPRKKSPGQQSLRAFTLRGVSVDGVTISPLSLTAKESKSSALENGRRAGPNGGDRLDRRAAAQCGHIHGRRPVRACPRRGRPCGRGTR